MRIVFTVFNASLGGNTRTAVSTAVALRNRGHEIRFVTSVGAEGCVISDAGFEINTIKKDKLGRYLAVERLIKSLWETEGLDVVHAFDQGTGVVETAMACRRIGIPFCWTICGGPPVGKTYGLKKFVSLTREIQRDFARRGDKVEVSYMPARMDIEYLEKIKKNKDVQLKTYLENKYGLPSDAKVVLRVARQANQYVPGILNGMRATAELFLRGENVRFLHIGYPYDDEAQRVIDRFRQDINRKCRDEVAFSLPAYASRAIEFLSRASVAIAAGRSAFESMFWGVPTVISAENGGVRLIHPGTVEEELYYNFSGRGLSALDERSSINALVRILEDCILRREDIDALGCFSRKYCLDHLDARIAARFYEDYYSKLSTSDLIDVKAEPLYLAYARKAGARFPRKYKDKIKKLCRKNGCA